MSRPHARGGEKGLKGNLALSKLAGKYSWAISGLGMASEGMPLFDQIGQYLRPDRPEGKKEFGGNRSHPPVSKWESGFKRWGKIPIFIVRGFSTHSHRAGSHPHHPAPPTATTPRSSLTASHGSSHLEQWDTGR